MVERIREILSQQQLTPTQFADAIGVARPIVSHILSGRNKPSLEVVLKIITAFPALSLPWLLHGAGAMLAPEATAPSAPLTVPPIQQAGSKAPESTRGATTRRQTGTSPSVTSIAPPAPISNVSQLKASAVDTGENVPASLPQIPALAVPDASTTGVAPITAQNQALTSAENLIAPPEMSRPALAASATGEQPNKRVEPVVATPTVTAAKSIRRIVIFYHDGTFADYKPEN